MMNLFDKKDRLIIQENTKLQSLSATKRSVKQLLSISSIILCCLIAYFLLYHRARSPPHHPAIVPEKALLSHAPLKSDRYLSYLPHSGFHNQRIALENALTLAAILNRTLVMPPCLIGTAVPFIEFDKLAHRLKTISPVGFEHCASDELSSRECLGVSQETWLDWKHLINTVQFAGIVQVMERPSFDEKWLYGKIGIRRPEQEVYRLKDVRKYHYRFLISRKGEKPPAGLEKFEEWVDVRQQLGGCQARLLQLGSLFGSGRLKIMRDPGARQLRSKFRRAMVFHHPVLDSLSRQIATQMSGETGFYGVHIRLGDNLFRSEAKQRVSVVINRLVLDQLKLPLSSLDEAVQAHNRQHHRSYNSPCRGSLHTNPSLTAFNQPLFIATDAPVPEIEPTLSPLFEAFPCTYLLSDFDLTPLEGIKNPRNALPIGSLMVPFLDAMVVAQARGIVGTAGSTFSRFVTDVLFPTHNNLPIIELG